MNAFIHLFCILIGQRFYRSKSILQVKCAFIHFLLWKRIGAHKCQKPIKGYDAVYSMDTVKIHKHINAYFTERWGKHTYMYPFSLNIRDWLVDKESKQTDQWVEYNKKQQKSKHFKHKFEFKTLTRFYEVPTRVPRLE